MIRTKPPSDEYRDGWERVFGDVSVPEHKDNTGAACRNGGKCVPVEHLDHDACYVCGDLLGTERQHQARTGHGWPTIHESDCPAVTGDGSCRCPMGNL